MFCTQCGHQILEGADFCTNCGSRIAVPNGDNGMDATTILNPPQAPNVALQHQAHESFAEQTTNQPFMQSDFYQPNQQPDVTNQQAFQPNSYDPALIPSNAVEWPQAIQSESPDTGLKPTRGQQRYQTFGSVPDTQSDMTIQYAPEKKLEQKGKKGNGKIIAIAIAVLAVAALVVAGLMTNWFGFANKSSSPASSTPAHVSAQYEARASVNDYSWPELKQIANELSAAENDEAALELAKYYGLVNPDGKLDGTQTKQVVLNDGTKTSVTIVGFRQDVKSDNSGRAGITFMFDDAIDTHEFNETATTNGGWDASSIRGWLNRQLIEQLPSDLTDVISQVAKPTNNVGQAKSSADVTNTNDKLWLFSRQELIGDRHESEFKEGNGYQAEIYNAEGDQYQLFRNKGISYENYKDALVKTSSGSTKAVSWWERTSWPRSSSDYMYVSKEGVPDKTVEANKKLGVVPGFAL